MGEYANKLYKKVHHLLQDKENYLAYIQAEKAERGERARINFADKKGREEEKIKIATKMKNRGDSVEDIAEITSLSPEVIEKL